MNESIVISLSGKKGSGKDTISEFIAEHFKSNWAAGRAIRKPAATYAFADHLKTFCIDVLGLRRSQCYGTDEEKNTPTKYRWDAVTAQGGFKDDFKYSDNEHMTGREVMQVFGTESVRAWFGNVWADATIRKIKTENPQLALITDNRFPSEVETVLDFSRGYVIRLTRSPHEGDEHSSETSLDDFDWLRPKCYMLNNAIMDKEEQKEAITPILETIFQQELVDERI